ncbi:hypothetical protein BJ508DRAFT_323558 [Ascobolus immersus RN42]|uniref:Uncharacterized protein n=1 Tax=Ascobolus immersus RN42 TaxID=1160509 RepID=A0A3N4IKD7_ASCIM|nr:hypothetical protein BJ508DRAFT_323558 [Ascobolus immersus RN42]
MDEDDLYDPDCYYADEEEREEEGDLSDFVTSDEDSEYEDEKDMDRCLEDEVNEAYEMARQARSFVFKMRKRLDQALIYFEEKRDRYDQLSEELKKEQRREMGSRKYDAMDFANSIANGNDDGLGTPPPPKFYRKRPLSPPPPPPQPKPSKKQKTTSTKPPPPPQPKPSKKPKTVSANKSTPQQPKPVPEGGKEMEKQIEKKKTGATEENPILLSSDDDTPSTPSYTFIGVVIPAPSKRILPTSDALQKAYRHRSNINAFTWQNTPPITCKFSTYHQNRLREWLYHNSNKIVHKVPVTYLQLRDQARSKVQFTKGLPLPNATLPTSLIPSFQDEDDRSLLITDSENTPLAFRFRIPVHLIENLEKVDSYLPQRKRKNAGRGDFVHRHFAVWGLHMKVLKQSVEFRRDKDKGGQAWLDANSELFQYLTEQLQLGFPEQFTRMERYRQDCAKTGYPTPMAGGWHGLAINQRMDKNGGDRHLDWNDTKTVFNAVVPYGTWDKESDRHQPWVGGNVFLPSLNLELELRRAEVLFFFGRIIEHQVRPISFGYRNVLDLFCHNLTFKRSDELVEMLGQMGHRAEKGRGIRTSTVKREKEVGKIQAKIRKDIRDGKL